VVRSTSSTGYVSDTCSDLVWYASYGSNMDEDRFMCYVAGGKPKGGNRVYTGCSDPTPPLATVLVELPYPHYFAGESPVWTGGVAFLGLKQDGSTTKGKAHLITKSQFEDVSAQEGRVEMIKPFDLTKLRKHTHIPVGGASTRYDELLYCGEFDGYPIVSVTSSIDIEPISKPSPVYLRMITRALREDHQLTTTEVAAYLHKRPGILGNYTADELDSVIRSVSVRVDAAKQDSKDLRYLQISNFHI
jgi:hypothetical protein